MFFEKNRRLLIGKNGAVESAAFCTKKEQRTLSIHILFVFLKEGCIFKNLLKSRYPREMGINLREERQEWNESLHSDP